MALTMTTKICLTCGKPFNTNNYRIRYCSEACKRVAQRKCSQRYYYNVTAPSNHVQPMTQQQICANPNCKKTFIKKVGNQIFCSDACRKTIINETYKKIKNKKRKRVKAKYSINDIVLISTWYQQVHGIKKQYGVISNEVDNGKEYNLNVIRAQLRNQKTQHHTG